MFTGVTGHIVGFVMCMLNKIKIQQITNLTLRHHRLNNETRNRMRPGNNNLTCAHRKLRSACAYAQSDPSLHCPFEVTLSLATQQEHSKNYRYLWVFAGCTCQNVNFGHAQASMRFRKHTKLSNILRDLKSINYQSWLIQLNVNCKTCKEGYTAHIYSKCISKDIFQFEIHITKTRLFKYIENFTTKPKKMKIFR